MIEGVYTPYLAAGLGLLAGAIIFVAWMRKKGAALEAKERGE